jgi:hypothetical protein
MTNANVDLKAMEEIQAENANLKAKVAALNSAVDFLLHISDF